ncbi:MAG TPA: hypothetical protein VHX37_08785 [Acidobacteriaceae bacterium]|jgi:hypothetical protein|nr:hypothetical protein [Acidobacteriaceae bacterium]
MRPETLFRAIRGLTTALLILAAALAAFGQTSPAPDAPAPVSLLPAPAAVPPDSTALPASVQPLLAFRDSDVKFSLSDLMDVLRDRRHEGWVLAAYPDPKTGRPLIGAGFSLDLPERPHPQTDLLNPHPFLEPSSAELWQAAGLDSAHLQQILDGFDENAAEWRQMRRRHRRIPALAPEITDSDAESLLRIAAIQAIENARAYCRNFDQLTGPQQMALSQLVYQMGVNLGEFDQFLSMINQSSGVAPAGLDEAAPAGANFATDVRYWSDVQDTLIHSQWARLYRVRAVSVIAMLDPRYADDPAASEHRIAAVLRPVRHYRRRSRPALRTAAYHPRSGRTLARKSSRARRRRA